MGSGAGGLGGGSGPGTEGEGFPDFSTLGRGAEERERVSVEGLLEAGSRAQPPPLCLETLTLLSICCGLFETHKHKLSCCRPTFCRESRQTHQ